MRAPSLIATASAFLLSSCGPSAYTADVQKPLPPLPSLIITEHARGLTPLPKGPLASGKASEQVLGKCRMSEVDKQRALELVMIHDKNVRAYYSKKSK